MIGLLRGDKDTAEFELEPKAFVKIRQNTQLPILPLCSDRDLLTMINSLGKTTLGISNILIFLPSFKQKIEELRLKQLVKIEDSDIQYFKNETNVFICKQLCPCCSRICGEDDPNHKYHQVKYGHQMRAIGGIKLNNGEASVSRCEDIADSDIMQYNGVWKSWLEFKQEMRNHPNTPWIFSDLNVTKKDEAVRDRFKYVWTVVGRKICSEKWKSLNIKYVEYNQANLSGQKATITQSPQTYYIFAIDSSASMSGQKWTDLQNSLKKTLGEISKLNTNNKATILNFSSDAMIEFEGVSPLTINVGSLRFQNGSTNFEKALLAGLNIMKKNTSQNYVMIFMTDGEPDFFPTLAINEINQHFASIGKEKFEFSVLGFQCTSQHISNMASELGGRTYWAPDANKLTTAFFEILNIENK